MATVATASLDTQVGPSTTIDQAASPQSRLFQLDVMRGYFVMILVAVHLDYVPSLLGYVDGRGQLWISEAEGFFMISGLLVAMMRRRDIEKAGMRLALKRSWGRAAKLYVIACTLTIGYTAIARIATNLNWIGAKGNLDVDSSWWRVVYQTLNLHYVYGWADFLTFYAPLFVVAPLFVWMMAHRMTWLAVAMSVAAYESMSYFSFWGAAGAFIQWQVYFVLGGAIGYHFSAISSALTAMGRRTQRALAITAIASATALYAAGTVMLFAPSIRPTADWYDKLIFDNRLGMLRPVFALIMFAGGYAGVTALRKPIMATVGSVLTLFGRNSLYVYIVQSAIVFTVPFITGGHGFFFNTALDFSMIALMWFALRKHFLFRVIPR